MTCRGSKVRSLTGIVAAVLVAGWFIPAAVPAETVPPDAVKATYLLNMAKLVTWPDEAFEDRDSPLVLGVLGDTPITPYLEQVIRGRTAKKRPLQLRRLPVVEGALPTKKTLSSCHLLFVSTSERERLQEVLRRLEGSHVMSVSDIESFSRSGGVAELQLTGATIDVLFNESAAEAAGLRPSARLLSLVTRVAASR